MNEDIIPQKPGVIGAASILFGLCVAQPSFAFSNQNTYFLAGAAKAGVGELHNDWLASQTDHIPLFSSLAKGIWLSGQPSVVAHLLQILLLACFGCGLYLVARSVVSRLERLLAFWLFWLGLIALQSEWIGLYLGDRGLEFVGLAHRLLMFGVAGQYLGGVSLQPSEFGVLVVLGIGLACHRRPLAAVICAVVGAAMHPSYVTHMVLVAAAIGVWGGGVDGRRRIQIFLVVLISTSLFLFYYSRIGLIGAEFVGAAPASTGQHILVGQRIAHHALPSKWFGFETVARVGIVGMGIWLSREQRFVGRLLLVTLVLSTVTGIIAHLVGSPSLLLAFPWRVSVWLVPISTALILASVVVWVQRKVNERNATRLQVVALTICIFMSLAGVIHTATSPRLWPARREPIELLSWVKEHREPGQRYLVPIHWKNFRLETGVPIFIDWKSHPYRSQEIVDWYKRNMKAQRYYTASSRLRAESAFERVFSVESLSHVVALCSHFVPRSFSVPVLFRSTGQRAYCVYKVRGHGE